MANYQLTAEEKKVLNKTFWRSCGAFLGVCNIYMQGRGFAYSMIPALKAFYPKKEDFAEALTRHNELFNTHTIPFGLVVGVAASMEKLRAEKGAVEGELISTMKMSLMGPLAGIGDSFFFNCVRVVAAGIAIGFSSQGSVLGPILFILLYGVSGLAVKYWMLLTGYKTGVTLVETAFDKGYMPIITKCAGILGMMMVGAMLSNNVRINVTWAPVINGASVSVQGILDAFLPGMLSLILWFVMYRLFKKGTQPWIAVFIIIGTCILLCALGIL